MSECCTNELVIVQGTTPILILNLNYDISQDYDVSVAVKTGINKKFILTNDDLVITPNECGCQVDCQFTQEQTLMMNRAIWVQLKAKDLFTGNVIGTLEYQIDVVRIIDKGVM